MAVMSNPFATIIEKTAPTPHKNTPRSDENAKVNENHDSRSDTDSIPTPAAKEKSSGFITPNTGKNKITRTSSFRYDLVSPASKTTGRARSASNKEMSSSATPSKATSKQPARTGTYSHETNASSFSRSLQKKSSRLTTTVDTPTGNRANITRNKEAVTSTSKKVLTRGKKTRLSPKMLDNALRESLGGFGEVTLEMQAAAKKQRENANNLRRRRSQSNDEKEIESNARRQSIILLNEFKELVKTANGDTEVTHDCSNEAGERPEVKANPRRESATLDQALVRQILPPKVCIPLREGRKVPPEAFQE